MTPAEQLAYDRGAADVLDLVEAVAAVAPTALVLLGQGQVVNRRQFADAIARIDPRALRVLRPFDPAEAIGPKQAAAIAGRSESAIRVWADRFGIGRRVVGSTLVSRIALAMLLDDNLMALAAYLSGIRSGPVVGPYFVRPGLGSVCEPGVRV